MKRNINRGDVKCPGMLRIHPVILVDLLCYTRNHRHLSALTEKNNTLDISDIIPILSKRSRSLNQDKLPWTPFTFHHDRQHNPITMWKRRCQVVWDKIVFSSKTTRCNDWTAGPTSNHQRAHSEIFYNSLL